MPKPVMNDRVLAHLQEKTESGMIIIGFQQSIAFAYLNVFHMQHGHRNIQISCPMQHKDMALSISLEAAELLEHFQWKNGADVDTVATERKDEIADEMADIFLYLPELSDNMGMDLMSAANRKFEKNKLKYPADKFRGISTKYGRV